PGTKAADTKADSVKEEFLAYAKMSPMERLRASILKQMGLTEDSLKSMPSEERLKVENAIKEKVKEALNSPQDGQSSTPSSGGKAGAVGTSPLSSGTLGQMISLQASQQPGANATLSARKTEQDS
ncbi:MAG TPA: hypothetical protein VGN05_09815, partial [Parvibaculum sp.]